MIAITNIIFFWWLPSFILSMIALYIADDNLHDLLIKDIVLICLLNLVGGWFGSFFIIVLCFGMSSQNPNSFWNKPIFKKKELDND